jgi:pimeloyl-ACP methyl ester carboxylesterase
MHRTARLIGDKLFPKPDQQPLRDYIAAQWVKNDPKDYVRVTKATLNHRLGRGVGAITSPTLVIAAAHDGTIPRAAMEELAAWIPDARLTIVPDCGHGAPLEVPDQIADLILGFTA